MTDNLEKVLTEALEDEYKARATYLRVLEKFGNVRPFSNIYYAEDRHANALISLFNKYQIPVPVDDWYNKVAAPDTLKSAALAGVEGEIENAEMYDRLLAQSHSYPDVQRVLKNLQRASQQNHLPAFQRAAQRFSDQSGSMASLQKLTGSFRSNNRDHRGRSGNNLSLGLQATGANRTNADSGSGLQANESSHSYGRKRHRHGWRG